jgi:isopenicillin-N N-acyltransferase like protein
VEDGIPKKIPSFLKKGLSNFAIGAVLDLNYEITLPFTNKKYYEEMRGMADGSGVDFKYFKRVHMIGELTKGACSMFGAWGTATSEGQTVQLRALDWVTMSIFRTSTDPTTNILLWWSTILAAPSSGMPG